MPSLIENGSWPAAGHWVKTPDGRVWMEAHKDDPKGRLRDLMDEADDKGEQWVEDPYGHQVKLSDLTISLEDLKHVQQLRDMLTKKADDLKWAQASLTNVLEKQAQDHKQALDALHESQSTLAAAEGANEELLATIAELRAQGHIAETTEHAAQTAELQKTIDDLRAQAATSETALHEALAAQGTSAKALREALAARADQERTSEEAARAWLQAKADDLAASGSQAATVLRAALKATAAKSSDAWGAAQSELTVAATAQDKLIADLRAQIEDLQKAHEHKAHTPTPHSHRPDPYVRPTHVQHVPAAHSVDVEAPHDMFHKSQLEALPTDTSAINWAPDSAATHAAYAAAEQGLSQAWHPDSAATHAAYAAAELTVP